MPQSRIFIRHDDDPPIPSFGELKSAASGKTRSKRSGSKGQFAIGACLRGGLSFKNLVRTLEPSGATMIQSPELNLGEVQTSYLFILFQ